MTNQDKALIHAHRTKHRQREGAIMDALQTLVMIGDPDLHEDNRAEWSQLVCECIPSKTVPAGISCESALESLKFIAESFETFTIQSPFFHVTGMPMGRPKMLRPISRSKPNGCLCHSKLTVRMWSTADEDFTVLGHPGSEKKCVFQEKSNHHQSLLFIANGQFDVETRLAIETSNSSKSTEVKSKHDRPTIRLPSPSVGGVRVQEAKWEENNHGRPALEICVERTEDPQPLLVSSPAVTVKITVDVDEAGSNKFAHEDFKHSSGSKTQHRNIANNDANDEPESGAILSDPDHAPHSLLYDNRNDDCPPETSSGSSPILDARCNQGDDSSNAIHSEPDDASHDKYARNVSSDFEDALLKEPVSAGRLAQDDRASDTTCTHMLSSVETADSGIETAIRDARKSQIASLRPTLDTGNDSPQWDEGVVDKVTPLRSSSTTESPKYKNSHNGSPTSFACQKPAHTRQLRSCIPLQSQNYFAVPSLEKKISDLKSFFTRARNYSAASMVETCRPKVSWLSGDGGTGKSYLAAEYVRRDGNSYDYVHWIEAHSPLKIAQSYHEAALVLGLIRPRNDHNHALSTKLLKHWLQTTQKSWLLIFDDACDPAILTSYLPSGSMGHVLVTSRYLQAAATQGKTDMLSLNLSGFTPDEGADFFMHALGSKADSGTYEVAESISKLLDGLPLALASAAAAVKYNSMSLLEYKKQFQRLMIERIEKSIYYPSTPLYRQPQLRLACEDLNSKTLALLRVSAFLDHSHIEDSIALAAQKYAVIPLENFPTSEGDFASAKSEMLLRNFCVTSSRNQSLRMNRVLLWRIRDLMSTGSSLAEAFDTAVLLLLAQWPSKRKFSHCLYGYWPEFDNLLSHVLSLATALYEMHGRASLGDAAEVQSAFPKLLLQCAW
jgi:hypothetical protein